MLHGNDTFEPGVHPLLLWNFITYMTYDQLYVFAVTGTFNKKSPSALVTVAILSLQPIYYNRSVARWLADRQISTMTDNQRYWTEKIYRKARNDEKKEQSKPHRIHNYYLGELTNIVNIY